MDNSRHRLPASLDPDPQRDRLYEWERTFIDNELAPEVMSQDECADLCRRAAGFLGIRTPLVVYSALRGIPCRAVPADWRIEIAEWGRTRPSVLHEMAHLGSWDDVLAGDPPHGAAFLGTAIGLYAGLVGFDAVKLVAGAENWGLKVHKGRVEWLMARIAPNRSSSDFYDEDF